MFAKLHSLFGALFKRNRLESRMDQEMEFHLESFAEDLVRSGMSRKEAERRARVEFGGVEVAQERCREVRGVHGFDQLHQDISYAFRVLRKNPAFAILAIFCLTIGIGATTAVFSWIEGILLRPFPAVANQDRLVAVTGTDRSERTNVSWPDFKDFQKSCTLVDEFIADRIFGTTLSIGDRAERATGSVVSANYFQALGVHPILGRGFEPDEDSGRNAHAVRV